MAARPSGGRAADDALPAPFELAGPVTPGGDASALAYWRREAAADDRSSFDGSVLDPAAGLLLGVRPARDEVVIVRDVPLGGQGGRGASPCPETVHVAYLPADGRTVGVAALARAVAVAIARRSPVLTRMTGQIADGLLARLDARGVAVVVEIRGWREDTTGGAGVASHAGADAGRAGRTVRAAAVRGWFRTHPGIGAEVVSLMCAAGR